MTSNRRLFAVIPASGRSRRMGRPKLLLPFAGKTVLRRLLDVLDREDIADRVVVLRSDDEPLRAVAAAAGATIVQPDVDPPDMRRSVEHALEQIRRRHDPAADDGWLLIPADHPELEAEILNRLIFRWNEHEDSILVPTFAGRRGHPTLFRWKYAEAVPSIPPDQGLNWLLCRHREAVTEMAVSDRSVLIDLDTPEDYDALERRGEET